MEVKFLAFLTSTLVGGEWSFSCSGCFCYTERVPKTH